MQWTCQTQKSRLQPYISIRQLLVFLIEPWRFALRGELHTRRTMSSSIKPITSTAPNPQQSRQRACVPWGMQSDQTTSCAHSETHDFTTVSVMLCQRGPALLLGRLSHGEQGDWRESHGLCSGLLLTHGNEQGLRTCASWSNLHGKNRLGKGVCQLVPTYLGRGLGLTK